MPCYVEGKSERNPLKCGERVKRGIILTDHNVVLNVNICINARSFCELAQLVINDTINNKTLTCFVYYFNAYSSSKTQFALILVPVTY